MKPVEKELNLEPIRPTPPEYFCGEFPEGIRDQIRQGPWQQARSNANLCPPGNEMVMEYRDAEGNRQAIPIDDVEAVTAPEEMGEDGSGHSKIHFKEHLGKAALVVATGVILAGVVTIRRLQSKDS